MITYFKNQKDLAQELKNIIDSYWNKQLLENEMIEKISDIVGKNRDMMFNGSEYTSVVSQRLGKKRIRMINKIIGIMEGLNE